uniref:GATA-type domain-containing protein n=1 Tax=Kalanchoe fedtschenkoi TaxID=63787 RepID=A0A7N0TMP0_KALFE
MCEGSGKLRDVSDSEFPTRNTNSMIMMESSSSSSSQFRRTCMECNTTRTPLWRGGPAGPRSLCNACGIRHRKRKRDHSSLITTSDDRSKDKKLKYKNKRKSSNDGTGRKGSLSMRLMGLVDGEIRKLREEEEAAILLMALSYGYGMDLPRVREIHFQSAPIEAYYKEEDDFIKLP